MKVDIDLDKDLKKGKIEESDIDDILEDPSLLSEMDYLPSFSYNKGERADAENGQEITMKARNKYYKFNICEGDAVEISWGHSIYETDIKNFTEIKL